MKKQMTLIYYYVPQDKDDPQVPNVFGISMKRDEVRLRNIQENFPLAGQYVFRFKVLYEGNIAWLDLADRNAKLPTFKDKIMMKASRVSWQQGQYVHEPIRQQVKRSQTKTNTIPANLGQSPTNKEDHFKMSPKKTKKQTQNINLIDDEHLHKSGQGDSLL